MLDSLAGALRRPLAEPEPPPPPRVPSAVDENTLTEARAAVASALSPTPVTVDEIIRQCQLSPSVVSLVLLELDLAGRLERHPGNQVSLLS